MEVNRFRYILFGLLGFTALFQIITLIITLQQELSRRENPDFYNFNVSYPFARAIANSQFMFTIPILLCVAVIAIYIFVIWYRDFIGRSTFMYRLLMLPTARPHIYLAKATAIIIFTFSLLSFQLLLLIVENIIYKLIVPATMRVDSTLTEIIKANRAFTELFPANIEQFLTIYGLGLLAVIVIFTAILLERSYRGIGILYGISYIVICPLIVTVPLLFLGIDQSVTYFYPGELLAIGIALCIVVLSASILLSFRLLINKIRV